jgi:hypothetical protein
MVGRLETGDWKTNILLRKDKFMELQSKKELGVQSALILQRNTKEIIIHIGINAREKQ